MHRSVSHNGIIDLPRDCSGGDLTNYNTELRLERNSRTLTLRQICNPSIKNIVYTTRSKSRVSLNEDNVSLIEAAVAIFTSGEESRIQRYCSLLAHAEISQLSELQLIAKSDDVVNAISQLFQQELSDQTLTCLITILSIMFTQANNNLSILIDSGFCFIIPNYFENENLSSSALHLVNCMASSTGYVRDSLICNEIHFQLAQIALNSPNPDVVNCCCETLYKIFSHPAEIEFDAIFKSVEPIAPLLELNNPTAVSYIILAYVEMACKSTTIVLSFDKIKLYNMVLNFIQIPELVPATLKLIRILSLGPPPNVWIMINNGLLPAINPFLNSDYCPEVFWIFSNLIETLKRNIIQIFDPGFILTVLNLCDNGTFKIKKEGSYFLATYALFCDRAILIDFFTDDVIDLLVEMIGCGVSLIVLRIIDSLIQLVTRLNKEAHEDKISILLESDLKARLNDIIEQPFSIVTNRASYLLDYLTFLETGENLPQMF